MGDLRLTSSIAQRHKDLTFGFLREIIGNVKQDLPLEIKLMCLLHYTVSDGFLSRLCGSNIEVLHDEPRVARHRQNTNGFGTAYGHLVIPSISAATYTWTFKLGRLSCLHVGIDNADAKWTENGFHYMRTTNGYCVNVTSGTARRWNGGPERSQVWNGMAKEGDVLKMTLRLDDSSSCKSFIKYEILGKGKPVTCAGIARSSRINYRMAISMFYPGNRVDLLQVEKS